MKRLLRWTSACLDNGNKSWKYRVNSVIFCRESRAWRAVVQGQIAPAVIKEVTMFEHIPDATAENAKIHKLAEQYFIPALQELVRQAENRGYTGLEILSAIATSYNHLIVVLLGGSVGASFIEAQLAHFQRHAPLDFDKIEPLAGQ